MKTLLIAIASAFLGALIALLVHDVLAPAPAPASDPLAPPPPASRPGRADDLARLEQRLTALAMTLDQLPHEPPPPVRTEIAPSPAADLSPLLARLDRLEQQVAALQQPTALAPTSAADAVRELLQQRLGAIDRNDPMAFFQLAGWASGQRLAVPSRRRQPAGGGLDGR